MTRTGNTRFSVSRGEHVHVILKRISNSFFSLSSFGSVVLLFDHRVQVHPPPFLPPAMLDGAVIFYLFTICIAVGIWLVFNRYQSSRNRAVPFSWPAPEVRPSHDPSHLYFIRPNSIFQSKGSRPKLDLINTHQPNP